MAEAKKTAKKADVVLTVEELKKQLDQKRNDLLEVKRSHAAGELVNPKALRIYRKDIARLLTQIKEKEQA